MLDILGHLLGLIVRHGECQQRAGCREGAMVAEGDMEKPKPAVCSSRFDKVFQDGKCNTLLDWKSNGSKDRGKIRPGTYIRCRTGPHEQCAGSGRHATVTVGSSGKAPHNVKMWAVEGKG